MNTKAGRKGLISMVVPFLDEGDSVKKFYQAIHTVFEGIPGFDFEVICIDDGSRDHTLFELNRIVKQDSRFCAIELSRNFGKEAALTAGIDVAQGDAVIPIDADLQDPPELISALIDQWRQGAEVVLARRIDRSTDRYLKRKSAELFYRFHNRLSNVTIPENVGDFRLLDRVAVDAFKSLPERQRFLKGLFAWIGFKTAIVDYTRNHRAAVITI